MITTRETLITSLLTLVDVVAFMHDGCTPDQPDPEHCLACLAFEESHALDVLRAVGRPWELETSA